MVFELRRREGDWDLTTNKAGKEAWFAMEETRPEKEREKIVKEKQK